MKGKSQPACPPKYVRICSVPGCHMPAMNKDMCQPHYRNRIRIQERMAKAANGTFRIQKTLRTDNTSGYRGVSFKKKIGKYTATIWVDGHQKGLGTFDDPVLAAKAYDRAVKKFFPPGSFLRLKSTYYF